MNNNPGILRFITFAFLVAFFFGACKQEPSKKPNHSDLVLDIRINKDPQRLNPMVYPSITARQVFQYIFHSLADFHPESLTLVPILVKEIPEPTVQDNGLLKYDFEILPEAEWSDGTPLTGHDYAFTVKTALHPGVQASGWRSYIKEIKDVQVNPDNPKRFSVFISEYMLARETVATIQLYPAHIYDPNSVMTDLLVSDMLDKELINQKISEDSLLNKFASEFNSAKFCRDVVIGCGPYVLKEWKTNQYLSIIRKDDYWGNKYQDNPFHQAGSKAMVFHIVPDETTATSLLKNGTLDLSTFSNGSNFNDLRNDADFSQDFNFLMPQTMKYYYLLLNNRNPKLAEKEVRQALAHLNNTKQIINTLEFGLGKALIGHFHPSKSYYNTSLKPRELDISRAENLLSSSGWVDTNDNGIRDKRINDQLIELELDVLVTGAKLGQQVALILQQNAQQAGIKINLVKKNIRQIRADHLKKNDFDMAALVVSMDSAPDDPYGRWHSDNMAPGMRNESGFNNEKADQLIEKIRLTKTSEDRHDLYLELQEIIYEEQPVVFLYSPNEKIAVSKDIQAKGTSKRPGYLANTFTTKTMSFSEN